MRDSDVRAALVSQVLAAHFSQPDTLVRHELGIRAGRRRIDVAVVNGEISGWEIKSDEDTLARLAGQVEAYGQVLDRATLVTTPRWVDPATAKIPAWWGVTVVETIGSAIVVRELRPSADNSEAVDPMSLAQLLWRDEALAELRLRQQARGLSSKARHYVWQRLAVVLALDELRAVVRARLKARSDWPGGR
ncbi:sce7726 family protein [Pseudonocardia sediminis]|nr:sce7726 family protein [Pseudonocardia sediminis]